MDLTASNSQRRTHLAAIAVAAVLAVAVGVPAWTLSRADANVADRERVPLLVTRPALTVAPDAPVDPIRLAARRTVVSSEWVASELGTLRISRGDNSVEVTNAIMSSPSGQTVMKVGGMAAVFGYDPSYEALTVGDAGQVVLAEPLGEGRDIYNPGGRANSSFVVVDLREPSQSEQATRYDFDANIVPEVFTADGSGLFVIDHQPALNPTSYRVRLLDLATGELSDVGVPGDASVSGSREKLLPQQAMQGEGGRSVATNSGDYLFTLYNRQPSHENGVIHAEHGHGFIHALSLTGEWAVCIDLPPGFGQGDRSTTAITVDPDDQRLYVVDSVVGAVVAYDVADLDADALLDKGLPGPTALEDLSLDREGAISAMATADALWVAQGTELRAMSMDLETTNATYTTEAPVEALVTDDAGRSFAVVAGRLVVLPT